METPGSKWFVIVNPVAGGGRGLDHFPQISKHLRDADIPCEPVFTEHKFHATELTVTAVRQGYRRIIVVGGDGTLHEVVNGLFIQQEVRPDEVLLAVVAVGTGNDWVRTFGISNRYRDAVRAIREGYSFLQDVGVVSYEESHYRQSRYIANVAGVGFDAQVIRKLSHLKKKGHKSRWRYTWCLVKSYFRYKSTGVKVWVDDRLVYNNLLLSIAIGICKFNGGGIQQLPRAVADDGELDLSLIRPIHFWHILFRFRYLFNGGIYRIRHILQERGSRIRIESSPEVSVEADGELLGETPLEFASSWRASSTSGMLRSSVRTVPRRPCPPPAGKGRRQRAHPHRWPVRWKGAAHPMGAARPVGAADGAVRPMGAVSPEGKILSARRLLPGAARRCFARKACRRVGRQSRRESSSGVSARGSARVRGLSTCRICR